MNLLKTPFSDNFTMSQGSLSFCRCLYAYEISIDTTNYYRWYSLDAYRYLLPDPHCSAVSQERPGFVALEANA
jgi:hypothetical protein